MLSWWDVLARLAVAAVLGAVIGINRERYEWAAGLRTHMLVSVGAALVIIVSTYGFGAVIGRPGFELDPSRIAAQVVSGIGFLGAGTIMFMHRRQVVRGLTTAAGLWTVAAIGLAAGSGLYMPAVIGTGVAWAILAVIKPLEQRFLRSRSASPSLTLRLRGAGTLAGVERVLNMHGLPLRKLELRGHEDDADEVTVLFEGSVGTRQLSELIDALKREASLQVERANLSPRGDIQ